MVIEVTRAGCSLIFALPVFIVIIISVQFSSNILFRILFSIAGVMGILNTLRMLRGTRIVIDKATQTVTVRKPSFFLVSRQRVIPFSYVRSVVIDPWRVCLNIGGEEFFEIAFMPEKAHLFYVTREISRFIERELVDNLAKPGIWFQRFLDKVKGFFRKGGN